MISGSMNDRVITADAGNSLTLGIMQPYFFPYLGYFQLIAAADKLVLYDNCQFIKGGWVNRNRLLQHNGSVHYITVPLKRHSHKALISEVRIYDGIDWRKSILANIRQNYSKADFFKDIYPVVESVLMHNYETISQLNIASISEICRIIGINTEIVFSIDRYKSVEEEVEKSEYDCKPMVKRILSICKIERADHYLNAIGGTKLYSQEFFASNGIKLEFVKTNDISYTQMNDEFVPNLSILDVLMNAGAERTKMLLGEYSLV